MTKFETLVHEAESIPDAVLDEVLDFLRFLKSRQLLALPETALLSEDVLSRDWLTAEEDAAWQTL